MTTDCCCRLKHYIVNLDIGAPEEAKVAAGDGDGSGDGGQGEAPWKRLRVLTASSGHGAAKVPQPTQWGSPAAAKQDNTGA